MTILCLAMASSTVCLADMVVLGDEVARMEKKAPNVLLNRPLTIAQAEKARPARVTYKCVWLAHDRHVTLSPLSPR